MGALSVIPIPPGFDCGTKHYNFSYTGLQCFCWNFNQAMLSLVLFASPGILANADPGVTKRISAASYIHCSIRQERTISLKLLVMPAMWTLWVWGVGACTFITICVLSLQLPCLSSSYHFDFYAPLPMAKMPSHTQSTLSMLNIAMNCCCFNSTN